MKLKFSAVAIFALCLAALLLVTGCDEGMNMAGPVVMGSGEEPAETPGEDQKPSSNGEMKQPDDETPGQKPDPKPDSETPKPTITIGGVASESDGSITVSGTSTELAEGTTVTVTVGSLTIKTGTNENGAWTVTVSANKAKALTAGTVSVKAAADEATATKSFDYTPPTASEPTVTIGTVETEEDGSITVSGTSADIPEGETVTVTIGSITTTTTTDASGAWSATVPATETLALSAGTTAITVATDTASGTATNENSFEYATQQTIHGVTVSTEAERTMLEVIIDVWGYDANAVTEKTRRLLKRRFEHHKSNYGMFDLGTEIGKATFRRFVEYEHKKVALANRNLPIEEELRIADQLFEEAYGISADYGRWLVHNIYLEEKPEDRYLLGKLWQKFDISMEHLLLRIANPDATEEEILELLRESIRAGKVTIA